MDDMGLPTYPQSQNYVNAAYHNSPNIHVNQHLPHQDLEYLRTLADVGAFVSGSGTDGTLYCKKVSVRFRHPDVAQDLVKKVTVQVSANNMSYTTFPFRPLPSSNENGWAKSTRGEPVLFSQGFLSTNKLLEDLTIKLSDDTDPFKIFSADFQALREEQRLLVDFDSFPAMLIQLLENCEVVVDENRESVQLGFNNSAGPTLQSVLKETLLTHDQNECNDKERELADRFTEEEEEEYAVTDKRRSSRPSLSDSAVETTNAKGSKNNYSSSNKTNASLNQTSFEKPAVGSKGAEGMFFQGSNFAASGVNLMARCNTTSIGSQAVVGTSSLVALLVCDCEPKVETSNQPKNLNTVQPIHHASSQQHPHNFKLSSSSATSLFFRDSVDLSSYHGRHDNIPGWIDRREVTGATLCIIETNFFKELMHLSLRFKRASDADLRDHLATRVDQFKNYSHCLELEIKSLNTHRLECLSALSKLQHQYETVNQKYYGVRDSLKMEFETELHNLRAAHAKALEEQEKTSTEAKGLIEARLTQQLEEVILTRDNYKLQAEMLENKILALTTAENSLSSGYTKTKNELATALKKLDALRLEDDEKQAKLTELTSECRSLRERVASDQKEIVGSKDRLGHAEDKLLQLHTQKQLIEETLNMTRDREVELREALSKSAEEIAKGNEVIEKLQDALRKERVKTKRYQQSSSMQSQNSAIYLEEKLALTNKLSQLEEKVKLSSVTEASLRNQIELLTAQLKESDQVIKGHQITIDSLDSQLNRQIVESVVGISIPAKIKDRYPVTSKNQTVLGSNNIGFSSSSTAIVPASSLHIPSPIANMAHQVCTNTTTTAKSSSTIEDSTAPLTTTSLPSSVTMPTEKHSFPFSSNSAVGTSLYNSVIDTYSKSSGVCTAKPLCTGSVKLPNAFHLLTQLFPVTSATDATGLKNSNNASPISLAEPQVAPRPTKLGILLSSTEVNPVTETTGIEHPVLESEKPADESIQVGVLEQKVKDPITSLAAKDATPRKDRKTTKLSGSHKKLTSDTKRSSVSPSPKISSLVVEEEEQASGKKKEPSTTTVTRRADTTCNPNANDLQTLSSPPIVKRHSIESLLQFEELSFGKNQMTPLESSLLSESLIAFEGIEQQKRHRPSPDGHTEIMRKDLLLLPSHKSALARGEFDDLDSLAYSSSTVESSSVPHFGNDNQLKLSPNINNQKSSSSTDVTCER